VVGKIWQGGGEKKIKIVLGVFGEREKICANRAQLKAGKSTEKKRSRRGVQSQGGKSAKGALLSSGRGLQRDEGAFLAWKGNARSHVVEEG